MKPIKTTEPRERLMKPVKSLSLSTAALTAVRGGAGDPDRPRPESIIWE